MKRIFVAILASLVVLLCGDVYGKRLPPKEVPPVVYEGVKYTASQTEPQNGGFVQAWDIKTQKLLWQVNVYQINYDPNLERDVQDVFITSMEIKNSKLIVVNEKNEQFEIDLKTHAVRSVQMEESASPLVIGETFTIDSKILGETRRMNVYLPAVYAESPNAKFPVLYMPDGGLAEDFLHVAGLVQVSVGNGTMRPFILVGIENTQRRRDMTGPTENPEDKKIAPKVGGSALFRDFIRKELMPEVKDRYRTTNETAIVGESLAGLFIVETFLLEPDLFDTYIAFDPSLWWNNKKLISDSPKYLNESPKSEKTLFIASSTDNVVDSDPFADILAKNAPPNVHWHYEKMLEEKHSTIYHPAALKAFRFVFQPH